MQYSTAILLNLKHESAGTEQVAVEGKGDMYMLVVTDFLLLEQLG